MIAFCIANTALAETLAERRIAAEKISKQAGYIALGCSSMAATVYAELSDENAETVARMSIRKCQDEWATAKKTSCEANKLEMIESGFDRAMVEDAPCPTDDDVVTNSLRDDIIDWRVEAKIFGPTYYEEKRLFYKQRLDAVGATE